MAFPSPSLTPPTLSDWQFSLSNVLLGAAQPLGILKVEGLGDLATIRSQDVPRARDHGELVGLDLYGGRDVTFSVWAKTDGTSLQDTLLNFAAATVVGLETEQPLWFQLPNYPLLCVMCRPRKRTTPWDVTYAASQIGMPVAQFHCTDPRVYATGQSVTVGLPNPTAGLSFPISFPISFGSTSPSGVTVTNAGNTEMRPVLVITGPVTNPTVQNASITGTPALTFSNPTQVSYTVLAGDQLVVDLGNPSSILYYTGGVDSGSAPASRAGWLVAGSTYWDLLPGANLIQFLSQDTASVAGTCSIQWASSYML